MSNNNINFLHIRSLRDLIESYNPKQNEIEFYNTINHIHDKHRSWVHFIQIKVIELQSGYMRRVY